MPKKSEEENGKAPSKKKESKVSEEFDDKENDEIPPDTRVNYHPVTLVYLNANIGDADDFMNVYGISCSRRHPEVNSFLVDKKYADPSKLTTASLTKFLQNTGRIARLALYEHFGGKTMNETNQEEEKEGEEESDKPKKSSKSSKKKDEESESSKSRKGKSKKHSKQEGSPLDEIDTETDESYRSMIDFIFSYHQRICSDYSKRDYAPHFNYIRQTDENGKQLMIVSRDGVMAFTDDKPVSIEILDDILKSSKKSKKKNVSIYGVEFPTDGETRDWIIVPKDVLFTQEQAHHAFKHEGKAEYDTTSRSFDLVPEDDDDPDYNGDLNLIISNCIKYRGLYNYP